MSEVEANSEEELEDTAIEGENEPPPSKPKEKQKECPECPGGSPPWMATFADMATLLMAFFVLILSFANVNVPKFEQVSGSLAVAFGVARVIPKIDIPMGETLLSLEFTPSEAEATLIPNKSQRVEDPSKDNVKQRTEDQDAKFTKEDELEAVLEALEEEIAAGLVEVKTQGEEIIVEVSESGSNQEALESQIGLGNIVPQEMLEIAKKISDLKTDLISPLEVRSETFAEGEASGNSSGDEDQKFDRIRSILSNEIENGLVEVERDGDKIIMRLGQQDSFDSGRSEIKSSFEATLRKVGLALNDVGGMVKIEGHTDSVPVGFSSRYRSNWDLSSARSASVADYILQSTDLQPGNVSVAGFADSRPIASNDTPEGRARNRRIEVLVDG
jgi:chemotaxis protein MotB